MGTVTEQQLLDRSLACIYWPSSLKMAGCLLQKQQFPVTQKTATVLKNPPQGPFTTPRAPALHLPGTGTGTPVWSLLSLPEPPVLLGLSGKWPSSAMSSWEMAHFLPPWSTEMATACRLQAGGGLRARVRSGGHQSHLLALGHELWPNQEVSMHCSNPMEDISWLISTGIQM